MQAWNSGLYQYLSGDVHLQKGSSFANPSTLNLHANDTLPGTKPGPHGPSESILHGISVLCYPVRCIMRVVAASISASCIDKALFMRSLTDSCAAAPSPKAYRIQVESFAHGSERGHTHQECDCFCLHLQLWAFFPQCSTSTLRTDTRTSATSAPPPLQLFMQRF